MIVGSHTYSQLKYWRDTNFLNCITGEGDSNTQGSIFLRDIFARSKAWSHIQVVNAETVSEW